MPRVSVIVPAYNAEAHIRQALESVVAQTFRDWEVVVADDGSTDATAAIAASFGPRVRIVGTATRSGPAAARNAAIAEASGELLAFLDADDYWLPNYLAAQLQLYDLNGGAGGDVGIVAANACVLGPTGLLPGTLRDYVVSPPRITLSNLLASNPIFILSTVSPRRIVDRAGGFAPEVVGAEDHDLWLRITELGYRVLSNPAPLAVYRLSAGSLSRSTTTMARAEQAVYRRALARGNLTPSQRRIALRQLRFQSAIELVASSGGVFNRRVLARLPLLVAVAAENPQHVLVAGWRLVRGRPALSPFSS
jgi:glycosyltransferase involved in cell wall biosynthesis